MVQSANIVAYQVIIFTPRHSISGEIVLREKRLSDHVNDRADFAIFLRNVSISRLEEPGTVLHKLMNAVIPKHGIILLFEPPQQAAPPSQRFFTYVETVKNDVFLVVDSMEVPASSTPRAAWISAATSPTFQKPFCPSPRHPCFSELPTSWC